MPLHSLDSIRLRESCRSRIESIEIWLRRIIHDELSEEYGNDYINHVKEDGSFLIKKDIREGLRKRHKENYPRIIDAALFEDLISLISQPIFFKTIFKEYFQLVFPHGIPEQHSYLNHLLERLRAIRNDLAHAGTLNIKDAEFTLYFTTELIDSFRDYYRRKGKEMEYNVPQIIRITDSFGNVMIRRNFSIFEQYDFSGDTRCILHPGDVLSITIETDPSYAGGIQYRFGGATNYYGESNKLIHTLTNQDVGPRKVIHCQVQSTKDWHKFHGRGDDQVDIYYKVLPPIE